ncbi:hypothetical protein ScPMuIL_012617 [Solemya velum]
MPTKKGSTDRSRVACLVEDYAAGSIKNKSCELSGQCRATFLMDFSPDRTKIASTHGDHTVRITELSTGRCTHILRGHPRTPWCVSFHPSSNNILASGCLGGEVRIWDLLGGGSEVWRLDNNIGIASLTFHPTDQVLVFAASNAVYFWDWSRPEPFACSKTAHEYERVRMVRFDPYGHYLYTGIANNMTVQQIGGRSSAVSQSLSNRSQDLGEMYNNLAHRFEMSQHSRAQNPATAQENGGNSTVPTTESGYSLQPARHSPVHEEGLNYARDYAAQVTSNSDSSRLRSAPNYAALITHQATHQRYGMSGTSQFSCPSYNLPGTWSPPPRTAAATDYSSEDQPGAEYDSAVRVTAESSLPTFRNSQSRTTAQRPALAPSAGSVEAGINERPVGAPSAVSVEAVVNERHAAEPFAGLGDESTPVGSSGLASDSSSSNPGTDRQNTRLSHLYDRVRSAFDRYQASRNTPRNERGNEEENRSTRVTTSSEGSTSSSSSLLTNRDSGLYSQGRHTRLGVVPLAPSSTLITDCASTRPSQPSLNQLHSSPATTSIRQNDRNLPNIQSVPVTEVTITTSSGTTSPSITVSSNQLSRTVTTSSSTGDSNDPVSPLPVSLVHNPDRGVVYQMYTQSGSPASPSQADDVLDMLQSDNITTYVVYHSNGERYRGRVLRNRANRRGYIRSRHIATRDLQRHSNVINVSVDPQEGSDSNSSLDSNPMVNDGNLGDNSNSTTDSRSPHMYSENHTNENSLGLSGDNNEEDSNASPESNVVEAFTRAIQQRNSDDSNSNDIEQAMALSSTNENNSPELSTNLSENDRTETQQTQEVENVSQRQNNSNQDPESLQESFASITAHIEREMNELDRRITALRDSFNESLRALEENRRLLDDELLDDSGSNRDTNSETDSHSSTRSFTPPVITITRPADNEDSQLPDAASDLPAEPTPSVPNSLLETALRSQERPHPETSAPRTPMVASQPSRIEPNWYVLQRHHLHPHYSVSILDDTINRPGDAIQAAINRAIAGAFMGNGEQAVATNIINQTHRIQRWDFSHYRIPDITNTEHDVIIKHCKLHNDASCDISQDATLLATFVPSHRGFPDDNILGVFSLDKDSLGQCLYTKSFGPNAISVSISPKCQYAMVGLAAKRLSWVFTANQMVAQVYKLAKQRAGENSMKHQFDVMHPCDMDIRTRISVNSARWLPDVGMGMVYGTNRGDLNICQPGFNKMILKANEEGVESETQTSESTQAGPSIRRNLMQMLSLSGLTMRRTNSIATQTNMQGEQYNAGTQTEHSESSL